MAYKRVEVAGVGRVLLAKRRGAKNLRLSINAKGEVRVGMPLWAPYSAGIKFATSRADWIAKQAIKQSQPLIQNGARVGKSHRLYFKSSTAASASFRLKPNEVVVSSAWEWTDKRAQAKAKQAAEAALKQEALGLLPQRLAVLAAKHGFAYREVKVRKLTSRWGSCSPSGVITLSYYLMQLPWGLIDYVLLHELLHTKHMNHGKSFWTEFEKLTPAARQLRREVNQHKPRIEAPGLV
jgi:predicted metal-dependent hydrolase